MYQATPTVVMMNCLLPNQSEARFLSTFSFYAAEVGRTKLKLMSLCSASRELLIDKSFARFWVKAIFHVNETDFMDHPILTILVKSNKHGKR